MLIGLCVLIRKDLVLLEDEESHVVDALIKTELCNN